MRCNTAGWLHSVRYSNEACILLDFYHFYPVDVKIHFNITYELLH